MDKTGPTGVRDGVTAFSGITEMMGGIGTAGEKTRTATKITASIDEPRWAIGAIVLPGSTIGVTAHGFRVSCGSITRKIR